MNLFIDSTSDRKPFIEESFKSETRFYYLDFLPQPVVVQQNGKILYYNKKMLDIFNEIGIAIIVGKNFYQLIGHVNVDDIDVGERTLEIEIKYSNKKIIEVEIMSSLIYEKDILQEIIMMKDITEIKKEKVKYEELKLELLKEKILQEKNLEYDKLKTDFLSNISHELRTPLNIILSSLQVLDIYALADGYNVPVKTKNYYKIMKQNCFRLLRLINNFLDVTKIESGFYKLSCKNNNIVSIVEEITLSVVEYLEDKNIDIIFDTEIEEKIISCDEDKIERIILNLLSNAVKFTEPGGKIQVTIYDKGENVVISVKDSGIGIPDNKLKDIFDRFTQVDNMLTRKKEGTGIGLSIVKYLVEMQGGKICVKSNYGEGAEFLMDFPISQGDAPYQIDMNLSKQNIKSKDRNIEKLNIEFSDIYSV